jgi:hypothetical protein
MRRRKPVRPEKLPAVSPAWRSDLRGESRGKLLRRGIHGLFWAFLFGLPYVRGHWRARDTQVMYASAAACMYGGTMSEPQATGDVDDPSGYYAAMFLQGSSDWPARCEQSLRALAREPARLQFPSVKAAEADVHQAAQIVLTEIESLRAKPSPGHEVPLHPLWGLEMLRKAVASYAEAAGVETEHGASPISIAAQQVAAPTPTLLDIDAARDATVKVWGDDAELQVAAFDQRGVSYMRLRAEHTTRARLPRAGGLRSVVRQGNAAYLVWTTAADKCGSSHCAGRSMGLAPMPVPLTKIPEPRWVAAHPLTSPDRSLAWQGSRMWLAAANLDGTAQLVEFTLGSGPAPTGDDVPPLEPSHEKIGAARDLVVFADSGGALNALALEAASDGQWELSQYRDGQAKRRWLKLPRSWNPSWVRTCSAQSGSVLDTRYFVIGNQAQTLVGYVRAGVVTTWGELDARLPAPTRAARDPNLALACTDESGITIAFVSDNGSLNAATCARDQADCVQHSLAEQVTSVDVTYTDDRALVAFSGAPEQPQVRLRRMDVRGIPEAATSVPGPCWERWGGMCGSPTFSWAGARLVLAARSGAGLMALESSDESKTWSELKGTNLVKPPDPHILPRVAAR